MSAEIQGFSTIVHCVIQSLYPLCTKCQHNLEYIEEFDLPPGLPTWEYDVIRLKSDTEAGGLVYTSELLNRMGERGWELVSIVPLADKDGPRYGVFKRSWLSDYDE